MSSWFSRYQASTQKRTLACVALMTNSDNSDLNYAFGGDAGKSDRIILRSARRMKKGLNWPASDSKDHSGRAVTFRIDRDIWVSPLVPVPII